MLHAFLSTLQHIGPVGRHEIGACLLAFDLLLFALLAMFWKTGLRQPGR